MVYLLSNKLHYSVAPLHLTLKKDKNKVQKYFCFIFLGVSDNTYIPSCFKDITCSNLTGPWLYENYLSSTSTPVVNATKATISATSNFIQQSGQYRKSMVFHHRLIILTFYYVDALSKFPRNNRMLSPKAKLLKQNMKG